MSDSGWPLLAVFAAVFGAIELWARVTVPDEPPRYQPVPAASYAPAVTFTMVDATCADGWRSPSIGRSGACSWHGGVVYHYRGSDGTALRCPTGFSPPYTAEEQHRQRASFGSLRCR